MRGDRPAPSASGWGRSRSTEISAPVKRARKCRVLQAAYPRTNACLALLLIWRASKPNPTKVATRSLLGPDDARLAGTWELAYTSSSSFVFNEGFTGVAKTTPGGATFQSLTQVITLAAAARRTHTQHPFPLQTFFGAPRCDFNATSTLSSQRLTATRLGATDALIVGDTTMVETLALGGGSGDAPPPDRLAAGGLPGGLSLPGGLGSAVGSALLPGGLVVTVDGSWELKRRVNLMAVDQAQAAVVAVTAQSLRSATRRALATRAFYLVGLCPRL
jgi:hypothetical protein